MVNLFRAFSLAFSSPLLRFRMIQLIIIFLLGALQVNSPFLCRECIVLFPLFHDSLPVWMKFAEVISDCKMDLPSIHWSLGCCFHAKSTVTRFLPHTIARPVRCSVNYYRFCQSPVSLTLRNACVFRLEIISPLKQLLTADCAS